MNRYIEFANGVYDRTTGTFESFIDAPSTRYTCEAKYKFNYNYINSTEVDRATARAILKSFFLDRDSDKILTDLSKRVFGDESCIIIFQGQGGNGKTLLGQALTGGFSGCIKMLHETDDDSFAETCDHVKAGRYCKVIHEKNIPVTSVLSELLPEFVHVIDFPFTFVENPTNPNEKHLQLRISDECERLTPAFFNVLMEYYHSK
jgi:hypothetical protein